MRVELIINWIKWDFDSFKLNGNSYLLYNSHFKLDDNDYFLRSSLIILYVLITG